MVPSRFLWPSVLLILPLILLGLFGGAELGRQSERAERALQEQADGLVRSARSRLEEIVHARVTPLDRDFASDNLVLTTRDLAAATGILDLIVLDEHGRMRFPRPPPGLDAALPLHGTQGAAPRAEIVRAEALEQLGDHEGAITTLQALLEECRLAAKDRRRSFELAETRVRAQFHLGGLLRKLGRHQEALREYQEARLLAAEVPRFLDPRSRAPRDVATIGLLATVAIAELTGQASVLAVVQDISEGRMDELPDELLLAIVERLEDQIVEPANKADLAHSLETERHRRQGRRFAADYQRNMQETMRRRLTQAETGGLDGLRFHAYTGNEGTSLLAVRPTSAAEREAHGGGWIGLRLDVALLANVDMDQFLTPDENGFFLAILDPDGAPVLRSTSRPEGGKLPFELSPSVTLGGLQLSALPANPEAILSERRNSFQMRGLLVLFLCALGVGGAWLLFRASKRDSEVAALKVDLVSRVSHELKTPLALIKMYGETLQLGRAKDGEQAARFAGIISREADRLTTMIQRILDFSRQEAGTIAYQPTLLDVVERVRAVGEQYRPHVERMGQPLQIQVGQARCHALVDGGALEDAVINLLENAAKYTPTDGVSRPIELVAKGDQAGSSVRIEVSDRGCGIPEGEHERVFQSFYRASNAGEVRGAGLGLSLVAHFVHAHQGQIEARPREGGGTIISITLPSEQIRAANDSETP